MKKLGIILLFLLVTLNSFSQISKLGFPFIKTFTNKQYDGNPQVWEITQDNFGIIYLANSHGVIEFDGSTWTKYQVSNKSTVRKIFVDDKNNVFVGAENDFGYLDIDKYGQKYYKSLNYLLPKDYEKFDQILGIVQVDNNIVFVTNDAFFYYDYDTLKIIKGNYKNRISFTNEKESYTFSRVYGILKIEKDTVLQFEGSEFFKNIGAFCMIPYKNDNFIILSLLNGIYFYNSNNQSYTFQDLEINEILKSAYIFDIKVIKEKYFIFGTYYNGIIITDYNFNLLKIINIDNGLSNNTCTHIYIDKNENIWASTQSGINYIETSAPFAILDNRSGVPEVITTAFFDKEKFYLGSVSGSFVLDKKANTNHFNQIENSQGMTWEIKRIFDDIYISGYNGVSIIKDNKLIKIDNIKTTAWKIIDLPVSDYYLAGLADGIMLFKYENGKIIQKSVFEIKNHKFRWFNSDNKGNIWQADVTNGIYKYQFNSTYDSIINVELYDTLKGLPSNIKNHLHKINNKLYVGTQKGIYIYNEDKDFFEPIPNLNKQINNNDIWLIDIDNENNIWVGGDKIMGVFKNENNNLNFYNIPFLRFNPMMMQHLYAYNSDTILFCFSTENYLYFPKIYKDYKPKHKCLIRKVSFLNTNDTLNIIYGGSYKNNNKVTYFQTENEISKIKYENNSIKIEFSAPLFEGESDILYSFYLKGFQKDFDEWTKVNYKEYSNLREGEYTFYVKAKNCYNEETEITEYTIKISPPWHRTGWAYIIYILSVISIFLLINYLNTKRLIKQKQKLEKIIKQRTAEIQLQKEEIQVQNENLMQQKEEIQTQAEELEKINSVLEKLSLVASETDNAVVIMDKVGNFEWINEGFSRLYGYNFEELKSILGSNVFEVSSNEKINQILENCKNTKKSVVYESQTKAKNGEIIWVQTTMTPILNSYGEITKFVAIDSDIRKLKQYEEQITFKNEQITDSINYAKTIQTAILPFKDEIDKKFENFVLFKPKDIVSGDFYWFAEVDNYIFLAVVDCTGHGVPGAFMSMIGNSLLNQIVQSKRIFETDKILSKLHEYIVISLRQQHTDNQDGMDVCLCRIESQSNTKILNFTGAKRPLFYYTEQKNKIEQLNYDRKIIGGVYKIQNDIQFTTQELLIETETIIYLSSDGYIDQNDKTRKKFGTSKFIKVLEENITQNMETQGKILNSEIVKWMEDTDQRDDITIIGIKLK